MTAILQRAYLLISNIYFVSLINSMLIQNGWLCVVPIIENNPDNIEENNYYCERAHEWVKFAFRYSCAAPPQNSVLNILIYYNSIIIIKMQ